MKFTIFALVFSFSSLVVSQAMAEPLDIKLTCASYPMTTSFVVGTQGDELEVTVIHSYGSRYAPAINGVFTPNDIPILSERAKLVESMKDVSTFRWPLSKCRKQNDLRFECFGGASVEEGKKGEKIQPFAIYTTKSTEDGIGGKWDYLTVTLSFKVDGKGDPSVSMKYFANECGAYYKESLLR